MSVRPDKFPEWATDTNFDAGADPWSATVTKREPSAGVKGKGQIPQTGFASQYYNWLLNKISNWTKYHDNQTIKWSTLEEIWCGDGSTVSASANPLTGFPKWGCTIATGGTFSAVAAPNASYTSNWCELAVTTSAGSRTRINTMTPVFYTSDECDFWMEFDIAMSATADVQANIGFCTALPYDAGAYACFTKPPSSSTWEMDRYDGATGTSTSSGAPAVSTGTEPNQILRIEWCGANTPNGAGSDRVRYLSGGEVVDGGTVNLSTTTNIPAGASMYLFADVQGYTPASSRRMRLGRIRAGWNRFSY